jgi:hypothetical protein
MLIIARTFLLAFKKDMLTQTQLALALALALATKEARLMVRPSPSLTKTNQSQPIRKRRMLVKMVNIYRVAKVNRSKGQLSFSSVRKTRQKSIHLLRRSTHSKRISSSQVLHATKPCQSILWACFACPVV